MRGGDLIPRALTLAVLVPALVVAIFVDPTRWGVLALVVVASGLALDELLRMVVPDDVGERFLALVAGTGLIALTAFQDRTQVSPAAVLTIAVILMALTILTVPKARPDAARRFGAAVAGLVYVSLPMSLLATLKVGDAHAGARFLLLIISIPFVADLAGYVFGRLFGRHKIAPAISPGKSWEGAIGGVAGSVGAVLACRYAWFPELALHHAIAAAALGSIAGQCGDFFESALKRAVGAKDSGKLLPGHGGMLDRIDALLFAGPVAYYYLAYVAR